MADTDASHYAAFSATRRQEILSRVEAAAKKSGRTLADVDVMAVSKTVDVPQVLAALTAGWRHFAENRPQELVRKLDLLQQEDAFIGTSDAAFDMIGHLQTNKINHIVSRVRMIQSVRSLELARAISQRALVQGTCASVLLEVNVLGEDSKSGMAPTEAFSCLEGCLELEGVSVAGLMAMAPPHDPVGSHKSFEGLRELRDKLASSSGLPLSVLSCGMSDDFEIAVEEGSTLVRLGRVVFDPAYEL